MAELQSRGTLVFGCSLDDAKSHRKFKEKLNINFPLLVDPEKEVVTAYSAYGEKQNYGKTYMGVLRKTYLIDKTGTIVRVWEKVKPEGHSKDVLDALASLA